MFVPATTIAFIIILSRPMLRCLPPRWTKQSIRTYEGALQPPPLPLPPPPLLPLSLCRTHFLSAFTEGPIPIHFFCPNGIGYIHFVCSMCNHRRPLLPTNPPPHSRRNTFHGSLCLCLYVCIKTWWDPLFATLPPILHTLFDTYFPMQECVRVCVYLLLFMLSSYTYCFWKRSIYDLW